MYFSKNIFAARNRHNFFLFFYIFVISAFIYYRFMVAELNSTTLRKYIIEHHNHISDDTIATREEPENIKYILFWTKFWDLPFWYLGNDEAGEEMLKSLNCPTTNCVFTHKRAYLSSPVKYDAIVFHGAEYSRSNPPNKRAGNQVYVLANLESPFLTAEDLTRFPNFYNMTMTYRFDSDIPWNYGKIIDKFSNEIIAPASDVVWRTPEDDFFDESIYKVVLKKKKSAAWFASNCKSNSNREKLVEELKKFMNIDIFGKCGNLSCKKNSLRCMDMLTFRYMFYLSFENSLCNDYVTEKLYIPLSKYVIPIVLNGANNSFFAPPKSYIDANDFKSVDELSQYLNYLMDNPREYIKYFWWKKYYKVIAELPSFQLGFCDLCMKLNEKNFKEELKIYSDIDKWWREGMCTNKSRIIF